MITSETGAQGIGIDTFEEKLIRVVDEDWDDYVSKIMYLKEKGITQLPTPQLFYEKYYWENNIPNLIRAMMNIDGRHA